MCGRAILANSAEELRRALGLTTVPELLSRFNIAPTQPIAVVREAGKLELLTWGLAGEPKRGPRINVRMESIEQAYRGAFQARRCLVVVDGFYEWKRDSNEGHGRGRPFAIRREDGAPFALAGIWERRVTADGEVVESCAVVTGPARGVVEGVHDRMPVTIARESFEPWLTGDVRAARALLGTRAEGLVAYEVGSRVSSPKNDDAQCLEPAAPERRTGNLTLF
jgi:putative SOS response-associated peptidase YedK